MNGSRITNDAHIKGEVVYGFDYSHSVIDTNYYRTYIKAYKPNGGADTIPVIVSDKIVDVSCDWEGYVVDVRGQFRSHNIITDGKRHLSLFVFVFDWEEDEMGGSENEVFLDGRIGKEPIHRILAKNREITDILLAVNRGNRSDYIPCIIWGEMPMELKPGIHIQITGRMQSRIYHKRDKDGNVRESKIAYEVSVSSLEVIE